MKDDHTYCAHIHWPLEIFAALKHSDCRCTIPFASNEVITVMNYHRELWQRAKL